MAFIENSKQNSLTAPLDKDPSQEKSFQLGASMSEQQARSAVDTLNVTAFTDRFPRIEKFYADPNVPATQTYSLVSFVPSKGAAPDSEGVYGMLKVRGCFGNQEEANLYAEHLIRNVDSYHSIYHTYTGRPFPIAASKKYISETSEIDIKKKVVDTNSAEIRKKRDEESQIMKQIESKQQELLQDTSEERKVDPLDQYIELQVKKAHLVYTYSETLKKMDEMRTNIIKTREAIAKMDEEIPEYREKYMAKYREAREKSGLPSSDMSFIRYMVEDIDLGF